MICLIAVINFKRFKLENDFKHKIKLHIEINQK